MEAIKSAPETCEVRMQVWDTAVVDGLEDGANRTDGMMVRTEVTMVVCKTESP